MKLKNITSQKKGIALSQAFGAVLTLVLVGVLVIIGIVLFVSLIGGPFSTAAASVSVIDESLTPSGNGSGGGTAVTNATLCSFGNFAIITATNITGTIITSDNYTTTELGLVRNTTGLFNSTATPWVLNYSFGWGTEACQASEDMITQFGTYPILIGLVGTIIFLGLVIGVLVASFVFGRRENV